MTVPTADRRSLDILSDRVSLLYRQAPVGLLATLVNSSLVAVVLWEVVALGKLVLWLGAIVAVSAWRSYTVLAYRRSESNPEQANYWLRRFTIGALAIGVCWGLAGTLLSPVETLAYQMFILTVLGGMSAGAVPLLGSLWRVYALYAVPMLLPTAIWLAVQGTPVQFYISLMVFMYLGTVLASAARISETIKESLRLRYERSDLIERLSKSKGQLEEANRELAAEGNRRAIVQRKLQDANQFLERIMDSVTDGIFVLDRGGRVTRSNHALANFAGVLSTQIVGRPFIDLFMSDSQQGLKAAFESLLDGDESRTLDDLLLTKPSGETRTLSVSLAPILGDEHSALVGVARDVTDQRQLERMKEDFLSTVSHELRTPLTSIRGALGLIAHSNDELDEQSRSLLTIADSNSDRLLRLIDDLLDLQSLRIAKMRFQFSTEPVAALLRHAVEINGTYAHQHNVQLELLEPLEQGFVHVDRDRLVQVMTNLISNAAKFSAPRSTVKVYTERVGPGVRIAVKDSGPGIANEFRGRIFQRFSQADSSDSRNKGGTGLGLSICKSLVESMHGCIGFESEVGRGSTFYVELPLAQAPQDMAPGADPSAN